MSKKSGPSKGRFFAFLTQFLSLATKPTADKRPATARQCALMRFSRIQVAGLRSRVTALWVSLRDPKKLSLGLKNSAHYTQLHH
jgi:hypothetical protein